MGRNLARPLGHELRDRRLNPSQAVAHSDEAVGPGADPEEHQNGLQGGEFPPYSSSY